jgi:hypothetical protein
MRKTALILAAIMAVTAPSLAYAKKGKKAKAKPAAAAFTPAPATDNSKFVMEGMRQWTVPFQSMAGQNATAPKKAKKGKRAGKKSKKKAA